MNEIPTTQVVINDPFWSPHQKTNANQAIQHQWEQLEKTHCIRNFRLTAGLAEGFRQGLFFADSDAYKWLDAACRIVASDPMAELMAQIDEFIALLERAQMDDGYLYTYNQLHFPGRRWASMQIEHELYCLGHLIEAAVSHYQATKSDRLLKIAEKVASLLCHDFMDAKPQFTDGHEEIEIALMRLYHLTSKDDYLELASKLLERRGRIFAFPWHFLQDAANTLLHLRRVGKLRQTYLHQHPEEAIFKLPALVKPKNPPGIWLRLLHNLLSGKHTQQNAPLRQQTVPVGHAVRFTYLLTAAAMLCRERKDESLLKTLQTAWQHMVTKRMYVSGGIGSLPLIEGFGRDYELHPEYAYNETCAALGSMFWNWEMTLLSGDAWYADLFEWQLYNAAAVGMGLDGKSYFYNNPLACSQPMQRQAWYGVPCCPSNLSRTLAVLGKYIYAYDRQDVWVHQYIGSQTTVQLGIPLKLSIKSELPWQGRVVLQINPETPMSFNLHLRIPSWAKNTQVILNSAPLDIPPATLATPQHTASGYNPFYARYLTIQRRWEEGDMIRLTFDMPVRLLKPHPAVRSCRGMATLARGPLIYCLESLDNPTINIFTAELDLATIRAHYDPDLLGGTIVLQGRTTHGEPVTAIPYMLWGNRGPAQMTVMVKAP